jgi:hypothetical protein
MTLSPEEREELEDILREAKRLRRNSGIIVQRTARLLEGSGDHRQSEEDTRNGNSDRGN